MKTMIIKATKICFMMFAACFVWYACEEEPIGQRQNDGKPPKKVESVEIEPIPGGAILTYPVPDDEDLLYVKAVYERNGKICESKASLYSNTLTVEGYGDMLIHDVAIIAVDRSQNESAPLVVQIKPLEPEVITISKMIRVESASGGVNVLWNNASSTNISVVLLQESDSLMEYIPIETFYSAAETGIGRVRQMPAVPTKLGVYVQDSWGNRSATAYHELTPIYEVMFNPGLFKAVNLEGDGPHYVGAWFMEQLWNGVTGEDEGYSSVAGTGKWPHSITIDLGMVGKISRIRVFQRMGSYVYSGGNMKNFEVWGCDTLKPSGRWEEDGWIKLMDCESIKPSGLPSGMYTQEDFDVAKYGEDFEISDPATTPAVRYIRIRVTEAWLPGDNFQSCEIQVYGNDKIEQSKKLHK
jgi:hypothetical protein